MTNITLFLSKALLCISTECFPVLVGTSTPVGEYTLTRYIVESPGYGGDVLEFKEDKHQIYAIHRVWTLNQTQKRMDRIKSQNIKDRIITNGCINVLPEVYDLIDDGDKLIILP